MPPTVSQPPSIRGRLARQQESRVVVAQATTTRRSPSPRIFPGQAKGFVADAATAALDQMNARLAELFISPYMDPVDGAPVTDVAQSTDDPVAG